ncbi:unnamed protein product [Leptidea sinapis]|nr:unnamed protein product [Leptidea sinapis]
MEESPHKCPVCSRSFNQRSNLKTHLLTHTDHKPYECNSCGKVFRRNCDLRRHALTHAVGDVPPGDVLDVGEEDIGKPGSPIEPGFDDEDAELSSPDHSPERRARSSSVESIGREHSEERPRRSSPPPHSVERTHCHHNEPRDRASPYTMRPQYQEKHRMLSTEFYEKRRFTSEEIMEKEMRYSDVPEPQMRHPQLHIRRDLHQIHPPDPSKLAQMASPTIDPGPSGMFLGQFRKRSHPPDISDTLRTCAPVYRTRSPEPTNLSMPRQPIGGHDVVVGIPPASIIGITSYHKYGLPLPPPHTQVAYGPLAHAVLGPQQTVAQDLIVKQAAPKDTKPCTTTNVSTCKDANPVNKGNDDINSSPIANGIKNIVGIQPATNSKAGSSTSTGPKKGFSIEDIMRR